MLVITSEEFSSVTQTTNCNLVAVFLAKELNSPFGVDKNIEAILLPAEKVVHFCLNG